MNGRVFLLVALIAIVGLVGCAQPQASAPSNEPAISGQAVSARSESIRLWNNKQQTGNVSFELNTDAGGDTRIYEGTVQQGQTILFFDGETFFRGSNNKGEMLFTVSGDTIYVGGNTNGPAAYTLSNDKVYEGRGTQGAILYNFSGTSMYEGANTTGALIFEGNAELEGDIQFALPILADRRF